MGTAANFIPTPYVRTTDIASNAVSQLLEFANDESINFSVTAQEIANIAITTQGGSILLLGKGVLFNDANGGNRAITLYLRRGTTVTDSLLDQSITLVPDNSRQTISVQKVDSRAAGTYTYKLWADIAGSGQAVFRRLQGMEIKR